MAEETLFDSISEDMDRNFSRSIVKLRGASDDEISMGQRGDLMKPNSSEAKTKVSSITDYTDSVLEEPDRLRKKPSKDIAHPAKPDISAAAASLNPKLAALSLGNKGKRLCSGPKGRISRRRNRKDRGASIGLGIDNGLRFQYSVMQSHRLRVKLSKCIFGVAHVEYLGHVVSSKGVAVDPSKIESISQWQKPTTLKGLRDFLGLAGYYRKFVRDFGIIAKPLTNMLKKDNFKWSEEANKGFEELKRALISTPV